MNKKHFIYLFCWSIAPVIVCYLLVILFTGLLVILYNGPLLLCGDLLRFTLPILIIWILYTFYRTQQRIRALTNKHPFTPRTPIEDHLVTLSTAEENKTAITIRDLRLNQQQQFDHLELFSHEIKNYLATLTAEAENNEAVKSTTVKDAVCQANYYLNLLLNDERLAMDNNDFAFQWIDLSKLINEVVKQHSALFIQKQLIPQLHDLAGVRILTDQKWLRFSIEQLLSNAIKYSTPNSTIDISWEINQLQITDHGCGIPQTDLPRIYDNGFTGHNGHQSKLSTGMGLYLVKKISTQLNFRLAVSSQVDKGTTATLTFDQANIR